MDLSIYNYCKFVWKNSWILFTPCTDPEFFSQGGGGVGVQAIIVFAKGSEAIFSSFTTMWIQRKTLPPLICTCTWMYTLMPYTITIKPCMPTIYGSNNFCVKGA